MPLLKFSSLSLGKYLWAYHHFWTSLKIGLGKQHAMHCPDGGMYSFINLTDFFSEFIISYCAN